MSTVHRNHNDNETLSPQMKAVSNFCSFTHYRESCHKTLSSVNSTDPKEFISKAILATEEAVKKFFNYSDSLIVQVKNNNLTKMALNDCKDMMDYAVDSLQASYSDVGGCELRNINDHKNDLRTWLSAVISYQQSCLDGFKHDNNMKETMQKGIIDAHELTAKDRHLLARIDNSNLKPNIVVAKDGSGQFKTIDKQYTNIMMYGDGPRKTIVTGHKGFKNGGGITTWQTATFSAIGNGFIAKFMGFQNTAGPEKHEAVAIRIQSDKSTFFNCRIDAYQDTLYNQANRQLFRNCVISGTIDFIFGDSPTVIQNSLIIIISEQKLFNDRFKIATFLGRPWKKFSTTVIMESILGDFIKPEGWILFEGPDKVNYEETLYYAEYNNRGPGANLNARVNWKGYHKIDR
ncbi:hypothetical protein Golob_016916, partial [Gossypium lobatum]|nr:hypothetical protein [Gossypium lobatum]